MSTKQQLNNTPLKINHVRNIASSNSEIDEKNIKQIGKGGFGKVFKVIKKNKPMAVKAVEKTRHLAQKEGRRDFKHKYLLKTYPELQFECDNFYYTFADYVGEKNLFQYRMQLRDLDERLVWDMITQIQQALNCMNSHPYFAYHRDVKAENIVVKHEDPLHLVLVDFGLCQSELTNYVLSNRGTCGFIAPELKGKDAHSQDVEFPSKCDVYSFGKTICEFILGPYFNETEKDDQIIEKLNKIKISAGLLELIECMIEDDPRERFEIKQVNDFYENNSPSSYKKIDFSALPPHFSYPSSSSSSGSVRKSPVKSSKKSSRNVATEPNRGISKPSTKNKTTIQNIVKFLTR